MSAVRAVEPVGHYAVRLVFDDGHDTGLYTWAYLRELGETHAEKWQHYLDRLAKLRHPLPDAGACAPLTHGRQYVQARSGDRVECASE